MLPGESSGSLPIDIGLLSQLALHHEPLLLDAYLTRLRQRGLHNDPDASLLNALISMLAPVTTVHDILPRARLDSLAALFIKLWRERVFSADQLQDALTQLIVSRGATMHHRESVHLWTVVVSLCNAILTPCDGVPGTSRKAQIALAGALLQISHVTGEDGATVVLSSSPAPFIDQLLCKLPMPTAWAFGKSGQLLQTDAIHLDGLPSWLKLSHQTSRNIKLMNQQSIGAHRTVSTVINSNAAVIAACSSASPTDMAIWTRKLFS